MPTPRVIDLSHHNSVPKDFTQAKEAGVVGVIHKMTEGTGFTDSKVQARYSLAKQAGMAWGLYHFLRPGSMKTQAEYFVNSAKQRAVLDDDTLLAADHEDPGVSYSDLLEFLAEVERLAGRSPVIYSGHVLKEQCDDYPDEYRLWLAQYASAPTLPAGCEKYWLWQYTDEGEVPGVTPPTDLNYFEGTDAAFLETWSGNANAPPQPQPEPEGDPITLTITITIAAPKGTIINAG